ncbi:hypothetical protein Skr01_01750 [Sphaerisporangium krabiense]|nr:hypothetical protein Skr01_01750 [Sphaerisporangium krabiense]
MDAPRNDGKSGKGKDGKDGNDGHAENDPVRQSEGSSACDYTEAASGWQSVKVVMWARDPRPPVRIAREP